MTQSKELLASILDETDIPAFCPQCQEALNRYELKPRKVWMRLHVRAKGKNGGDQQQDSSCHRRRNSMSSILHGRRRGPLPNANAAGGDPAARQAARSAGRTARCLQIAQPPPIEHDGPLAVPLPWLRPGPPNPNVECCFSSSSLWQRGQHGVRLPTTSASNRCPQVLHWYSNKGMVRLL
jgi:hypothetical protein